MSIKETKAFITGCTVPFTNGSAMAWLTGLNKSMVLVKFNPHKQFNSFVIDNKLIKGIKYTPNIITLEVLVYAGTVVIPTDVETEVIKGGFIRVKTELYQ